MENKIEFDLKIYNSGEYDVVTRDDKPVKIAGVNEEAGRHYQVVGWIKGNPASWSLNGMFYDGESSEKDIFLIPKKKIIKGWAVATGYIGPPRLGVVFSTREQAELNLNSASIGLVYIETELIPTK